MKGVFLVSFIVLSALLLLLQATRTIKNSGSPIVYVTGAPTPETLQVVAAFRKWLRVNGRADVDLRLDAANSDPSKVIIQGISGIGTDLIQSNMGADLRYLHSIGLLTDLTEMAETGGFGPATFTKRARDETFIDGRQYAYPLMLYVLMNYVNLDTFKELGIPPPAARMTFEEFEAVGKTFVARANPPGQKQRRFFCSNIPPVTMRRSMGLDAFNETLTRSTLDDARNLKVLKLIRKWTMEDRLFPSAADMLGFASEGGSGASAFGPRLYQFQQGNIAIIAGGSYLTFALRELGALNLAVTEPPHEHFPNAIFGAGMVALYRGSPNAEAAASYLGFLASDGYYSELIRSGLGIPADLKAARHPAHLRPPRYPNEWGTHEAFVNAIEEIGIPYTASPFVVFSVSERLDNQATQRFLAGRLTAEEAITRAADGVNEEIQRTLAEQPSLRERYDELIERQREIEARRQRGEKVPESWLQNPFHRAYYKAMGWTTDG